MGATDGGDRPHPQPESRGGLIMSWWSELKYLARKLNRRRADRELEEEIRAHLEMEALEKVDDGLSPEEARTRRGGHSAASLWRRRIVAPGGGSGCWKNCGRISATARE